MKNIMIQNNIRNKQKNKLQYNNLSRQVYITP